MALPLFQETNIADGAHLIFLKPFTELSYKKSMNHTTTKRHILALPAILTRFFHGQKTVL